jgi:head-tail adaptor
MSQASDILSKRNPGLLRYLLTFQRNKATRNASGGFTQGKGFDPETVFTARGNVEPLTGKESFGDWTRDVQGYKVTIAWREDVTTDMRILFGARIFQIREAPLVSKWDRYLEIGCQEVRA